MTENNLDLTCVENSQSNLEEKTYYPWAILIEKIFGYKIIPGLERITPVDFAEYVQTDKINKYTMFIDGQFLFYSLRGSNKKIQIKKLSKAYKIASEIYYYVVGDKARESKSQHFLNVVHNSQIKGFHELRDLSGINNSKALRNKIQAITLPYFYVDMLSLLYRSDELIRDINAVIIVSNNVELLPAIRELIDNDIAVFLAVSKSITTTPRLMCEVTGIIKLEDYLESINALVSKESFTND